MLKQRRELSLKEKNDLLKKFDALPKCSQRKAALKLGISQSALCILLKRRKEITEYLSQNGNVSRKRKRGGKATDVEAALFEWFKNASLDSVPISRAVLLEKAKHFAVMNEVDFTPTHGWLSRWKLRYNIGQKNTAVADEWIENILSELKEYKPSQIYCINETGLYYRALPEHTLMFDSESPVGCEKVKQKITVLLTCNQDGSVKRVPLVIGTRRNPHCFKGVTSLPIKYCYNKNAWITPQIFKDFLLKWNTELNDKKIVLLLNRCTAHPQFFLTNIKLVYVPSSIIQPLDQGITQAFKCHYRKAIVKKIIDKIDASSSACTSKEMTKSISLLESMHMINNAWSCTTQSTIRNGFRIAGLSDKLKDESIKYYNDKLEKLSYGEFFLKYVSIDDNLPTICKNTNQHIIELPKGKTDSKDQETPSESESDSEDELDIPTIVDSRKALQIILRTLELNGGDEKCYKQFYELNKTVEKLLLNNSSQLSIDQFVAKLQ